MVGHLWEGFLHELGGKDWGSPSGFKAELIKLQRTTCSHKWAPKPPLQIYH